VLLCKIFPCTKGRFLGITRDIRDKSSDGKKTENLRRTPTLILNSKIKKREVLLV
jgi:hypothetical protein